MTSGPLWTPSEARVADAAITKFRERAGKRRGRPITSYQELHRWSVSDPEAFWREVWSFCGVVGDGPGDTVLEEPRAMPGARWFPEARLNFAENLLGRRGDGVPEDSRRTGEPLERDAVVFWGEDRIRRRLGRDELRSRVFRMARALRAAGVEPGDRVAAYLPNIPETVVAALGAAAVGAVWSSCSPDFGAASVLDRFRQIEPSILFVADGYFYAGTWHPVDGKVDEIVAGLPSLDLVVRVAYHGSEGAGPGSADPDRVSLDEFVTGFDGSPFALERFDFDHPLYILFSSGTTGPPKCIVHGAGGTLLQHLKEHILHGDVRPGDRLFYFTTCGWMMWNWLMSGLAAGATLLLYDGSPFAGDGAAGDGAAGDAGGGSILFDLADEEEMTHLGTSARFLAELENRGVSPKKTHSLSTVRTIFSTGSPLLADSFDYVYEHIKKDVCLSSISGGTDIVSCFVLGNPTLPVWRGEIQCKGLGMAVEVFDDEGRSVVDEKGELVCTAPFPSMPLGFWNDPDGERYRAAYFEEYPGVWCHGDYARVTPGGGVVIYGRSDTVLNPGGVRIGTAEIYRPVEELDEVLESVVVGQEREGDVRLVLFVRLRPERTLDEALVRRIRNRIRERASPRHVPALVLDVPDIPRTRSGKIAELAVRAMIHGRPVTNRHALANPESLSHFADRPELEG